MNEQECNDRGVHEGPGYIDMYADHAESPEGTPGAASAAVFGMHGLGVRTRGDPVYSNASQVELRKNVRRAIQYQNQQLMDAHYSRAPMGSGPSASMDIGVGATPASDVLTASASRRLKHKIRKFYAGRVFLANYRPFSKCWVYDASVSLQPGAQPVVHDAPQPTSLAICFANRSEKSGVTALMVSGVSDLDFFARARLLPLKAYSPVGPCGAGDPVPQAGGSDAHYVVTDGITDMALAQFRARYASDSISKEDIFYYLYGVLHSEDCSTRYLKDLRRDPPRMPVVRRLADFTTFCTAGRALANLHVNYDAVPEYPVAVHMKPRPAQVSETDYWRVDQMKFGARGDRTRIIYNEWIRVSGIPRAAYDYVINERPALVWAMESQGIKNHAASGLRNDANRWPHGF